MGPESPAYLQVSLRGLTLHLSEHGGDGAPGATVRLTGADSEIELVDPFGNVLQVGRA